MPSIQELLNSPQSPTGEIKNYLQQHQQSLNERFLKKVPVQTLVAERAAIVDEVLVAAWEHFRLKNSSQQALIAVGGYGRSELLPHSDVDLLILADQQIEQTEQVEKFITFLWDIGLDIGHSVRTIKECILQAKTDITIMTSLLEARTLAGNKKLLPTLLAQCRQKGIWDAKSFFTTKLNEQATRHFKHNNTEYNLEPDIKNAPGGLRDIHMISWVALAHFSTGDLDALVARGILQKEEYDILLSCLHFLWALRYALHLYSKRNENRLLFDYQKPIAQQFGYEDTEGNLAVENFMRRYYRTALAISQFNELMVQLFEETLFSINEPVNIEILDDHFQLRNHYLEIRTKNLFKQEPSLLLKIFVILGGDSNIRGIHPQTIRQIIKDRQLIDSNFRNNPLNKKLFTQLLKSPNQLFTQLRRMKRYGVLGRYLPAFGDIIGLMQFDLFHRYTVDAHTLLVIRNIRRFRHDDQRPKFPVAYQAYKEIQKPELLLLGGLFHDIAKGRGGNHSQLGAQDAIEFCLNHGFNQREANLVGWLVQNHLLMSMTAQKKDLSNPDIIAEFSKKIGDIVHLNYLFCLTVADINATNDSLWNGWRASLMRQLYSETKRALRRGLENPVDKSEWVKETRDTAKKILLSQNQSNKKIEYLWKNYNDEYFLRENPSDIAWHSEAILKQGKNPSPLVLCKETSARQFEGASQIFIYTEDHANLFAAIVCGLDQLNLNVVDARIMTAASHCSLNTFIVLEQDGTPIGNNFSRTQEITTYLNTILATPGSFPDLVRRVPPRTHKEFNFKTEVNINNAIDSPFTCVEVTTLDVPGVLAKIGRVFFEAKLLVHNAKINNLGERAEDIFFISDDNLQPLTDPSQCNKLTQNIKNSLDAYDDHQAFVI